MQAGGSKEHVRRLSSYDLNSTFDLSNARNEEEFKIALSKYLDPRSKWEAIKDIELGRMLDSLKVAEVTGALRDTYGLLFELDTLLLAYNSMSLLHLVKTHCNKQCSVKKSRDWISACEWLPRDIEHPQATIISDFIDNSEQNSNEIDEKVSYFAMVILNANFEFLCMLHIVSD